MKTRRLRAAIAAIAAVLFLGAVPLRAEEAAAPADAPAAGNASSAVETNPLIEASAVEPVKRMVETLTKAERMSFVTEESHDAIQADGEALEFGRVSKTTIRRPNKVAGETWDRGGRNRRFYYDGSSVVVYDATRKVYATTPRSGDIDSLLDFLRDQVGFKILLGDLFATDLRQILIDTVVAARLVDEQSVGGFECDHVALRFREGVDAQIWIRTGEVALPQRIVLNFFTAEGRPQFRADFRDWDLAPRAPDSAFSFRPPKGARMVPFAVSRSAPAAGAEEAAQ